MPNKHGFDYNLAKPFTIRQSLQRSRYEIEEQPFFCTITTVDHKKIGKRYHFTATAFLIIGGLEALIMRIQLAGPDQGVLTPEAYDQIFSMHGITMIFWYASPILAGFGNYLVPLMIGARDMAFPRLNAFTYWAFLFSGLFVYASIPLGMAPHAGWFAFAPYTSSEFSPNLNTDFYALSLIFLTVSTTAGAINFIATIFRLRAPGMSFNRMPLFMWSTDARALPALDRRPPPARIRDRCPMASAYILRLACTRPTF